MWGGGNAGWDKVTKLVANTKMLNRSSLVFQGVGNGEYGLGVSLEYAGYLWANNGAPVKTIYPADGTIAQMEGVAIVKNGPNTEGARKFADYVNRKDVREMILKETFRRPARQDPDLPNLPGKMPKLSDIKLVKYDEEGLDGQAQRDHGPHQRGHPEDPLTRISEVNNGNLIPGRPVQVSEVRFVRGAF